MIASSLVLWVTEHSHVQVLAVTYLSDGLEGCVPYSLYFSWLNHCARALFVNCGYIFDCATG